MHVARLDVPRKLDRYDSGARKTLRAVSGLVPAAQPCREDQDSDVKRGRGWLSVGRFSAMVMSLWARALRGCGAAAAQSESFCPKCQT